MLLLPCPSPPSCSGDVVAFKAVVTGDTTASSMKTSKAKALASGSYTFWKEAAGAAIGKSSTAGPTTSVQACLSACDTDAECAAVAMTGITALNSTPGSCSLIKGDTTVATFKRSLTKAVATRLELSAVV
jgi:phosphoribosyl-AMP cyclohydrolase